MEDYKKDQMDQHGKCMVCGMDHGHMCAGLGHHMLCGRHPLRWLVGLLILGVVFWLGLKVGEMKGYLEGGYYYGNDYSVPGYGYNMMRGARYMGPWMMGGWYSPVSSPSTSTAK